VGIWRLPSGEELDFNFELRYESLGDKYIVPKVENLEEKEDTSKIAKTAIPTIDSFPVYQGGEAGMLNFLSANIRYPRKAIDSNLTGIVYISFIVERDGSVGDVYCTKGVHPLLDKDAQRVVRKMRFDKPAYQRGKAVRMSYTLPVKFYLK
jgi:protein TonB